MKTKTIEVSYELTAPIYEVMSDIINNQTDKVMRNRINNKYYTVKGDL